MPYAMQAACPVAHFSRYALGMGKRTVAWAVGIIAIAAIALVAYGFHAAGQKRTQQRAIISTVQDSTDKLRAALTEKATPDVVAALDANLSTAHAPRDPQPADGPPHYTLTARDTARRRGDTDRRR